MADSHPSHRMSQGDALRLAGELRTRIAANIFGQQELITEVLVVLLAGGHILMTGAPGLAKTTLVRVIAQQLGLKFGRIQFTPDLLPGDITGTEVLNIDAQSGRRSFDFIAGPIFANLLLADEINRASPRTQSALLEAMQERSVTVGGKMHRLSLPFMVFATQNPYESEGTFPLPEAQLDRFLLHSFVDYPDAGAEAKMLQAHAEGALFGEKPAQVNEPSSNVVMSHEDILGMIAAAKRVQMSSELLDVVRILTRATRPQDESCPSEIKPLIWYGAGPRAGLSLVSAAKTLAFLEGEEAVRWRHIKRMIKPTMRHRIRLTATAMRDRMTEDSVLDMLVSHIETTQTYLTRGEA